ncbi:retroviruspolyprotein,putative, partial [Macrophomina phaseolina MS6]
YIDYVIKLEKDKKALFSPLYEISDLELKALRLYLDENLRKGFI